MDVNNGKVGKEVIIALNINFSGSPQYESDANSNPSIR
jgi:hypothetical protein